MFHGGAPWTVFETQRRTDLTNSVQRAAHTASRLAGLLDRPWTDPPAAAALHAEHAKLTAAMAKLAVAEQRIRALIDPSPPAPSETAEP